MPDQPRIVFLGTPEFAVASLDAMVQNGFNVVGVVTAPDKPAGRGMKLQQSAVKKYAVEHAIPLLQPEKLKSSEFISSLRELKADLQVVVAFRMLPEVVWSMPPHGTINVHASLLPDYRGAAPINWAIINGEKKTGITTFRLRHEIDTGDILLQKSIEIGSNETAGELHDRLKETGAETLIETITGLFNNTISPQPQHSASGKHAPKIFTETCRINWQQPVETVHNLIRGLSPYPSAFTELNGHQLKIFRAGKEILTASPGEISTDKKSFIKFGCMDGFIDVKELQLEGKKKMGVEEFLRGYRW